MNGWKNSQTWNVALWMQNDPTLYHIARDSKNYTDFRDKVVGFESSTPDKIRYDDERLDLIRLDELVRDIEA